MVIGAVILAGIALVAVANQQQDDADDVADAPELSDDWSIAYGVYDCDSFVDPFEAAPEGVAFFDPLSGTLGGFMDFVGATLDEDGISGDDIGSIEAGADCDGEPTVMQVALFEPGADEPSDVFTDNFAVRAASADDQGMVIANVPEGAEIPPPPQSAVDALDTAVPPSTSTVAPEEPADADDAPADADDAPADGDQAPADGDEAPADDEGEAPTE